MSQERSQNERYYDDEIAPSLNRLARACQERKIPFFSCTEFEPHQLGVVRATSGTDDLQMAMLNLVMETGHTPNRFMQRLLELYRSRGVDTSFTWIIGEEKGQSKGQEKG